MGALSFTSLHIWTRTNVPAANQVHRWLAGFPLRRTIVGVAICLLAVYYANEQGRDEEKKSDYDLIDKNVSYSAAEKERKVSEVV